MELQGKSVGDKQGVNRSLQSRSNLTGASQRLSKDDVIPNVAPSKPDKSGNKTSVSSVESLKTAKVAPINPFFLHKQLQEGQEAKGLSNINAAPSVKPSQQSSTIPVKPIRPLLKHESKSEQRNSASHHHPEQIEDILKTYSKFKPASSTASVLSTGRPHAKPVGTSALDSYLTEYLSTRSQEAAVIEEHLLEKKNHKVHNHHSHSHDHDRPLVRHSDEHEEKRQKSSDDHDKREKHHGVASVGIERGEFHLSHAERHHKGTHESLRDENHHGRSEHHNDHHDKHHDKHHGKHHDEHHHNKHQHSSHHKSSHNSHDRHHEHNNHHIHNSHHDHDSHSSDHKHSEVTPRHASSSRDSRDSEKHSHDNIVRHSHNDVPQSKDTSQDHSDLIIGIAHADHKTTTTSVPKKPQLPPKNTALEPIQTRTRGSSATGDNSSRTASRDADVSGAPVKSKVKGTEVTEVTATSSEDSEKVLCDLLYSLRSKSKAVAVASGGGVNSGTSRSERHTVSSSLNSRNNSVSNSRSSSRHNSFDSVAEDIMVSSRHHSNVTVRSRTKTKTSSSSTSSRTSTATTASTIPVVSALPMKPHKEGKEKVSKAGYVPTSLLQQGVTDLHEVHLHHVESSNHQYAIRSDSYDISGSLDRVNSRGCSATASVLKEKVEQKSYAHQFDLTNTICEDYFDRTDDHLATTDHAIFHASSQHAAHSVHSSAGVTRTQHHRESLESIYSNSSVEEEMENMDFCMSDVLTPSKKNAESAQKSSTQNLQHPSAQHHVTPQKEFLFNDHDLNLHPKLQQQHGASILSGDSGSGKKVAESAVRDSMPGLANKLKEGMGRKANKGGRHSTGTAVHHNTNYTADSGHDHHSDHHNHDISGDHHSHHNHKQSGNRRRRSGGDAALTAHTTAKLVTHLRDHSLPMAEKADTPMHSTHHAPTTSIVTKYVQLVADYCPSPIGDYILFYEPLITYIVIMLEIATVFTILIVELIYEYSVYTQTVLAPYKLYYLLPSLVGLIMCFFGGNFMTIIATIEAYRSVGYENTVHCINTLMEDFHLVLEANKLDDLEVTESEPCDADGEEETPSEKKLLTDGSHTTENSNRDSNRLTIDTSVTTLTTAQDATASTPLTVSYRSAKSGKADVLSVTSRELLARKTMLFLRTVDPHRFTEALIGINAGFIAVVANLKVQFAKTITLGNAISKPLEATANVYILPLFELCFPEEYKKWSKPILKYGIKSSAISIAWMLRRVVSSYHSAIRGGLLFSKNLFNYLYSMKFISISLEDTVVDRSLGYLLAICGIYFQCYFRYSLPFPLNVLLFPFTVLEWLLVWCINNSSYILQSM